MAWSTDWLLVPPDQIETVVHATEGPRDLWPHASFADGDIEGSDLNLLWSILQGKTVWSIPHGETADGKHICGEVIEDGGQGKLKLGRVSTDCLRALMGMDEADIQKAAAAWQRTGALHYATTAALAGVIRQLAELARRAVSEGQVILLLWWC